MQVAMESLDMARRKQIMEALSGFLQSTKSTIEQLCEGHSVASMEASKQRRASIFDMTSSVDKGLPHDAVAYQSLCKPDLPQRCPFASPSSSLNERLPERRVDFKSEATGSEFWRFSESEMDHAIASFLNEMRKTVHTWFARYRLLAEGKESIEGMPQPMQSDMHFINRPGFEQPEAGHNYSIIESLDDRDNEVLLPYNPNRQIITKPFVKTASTASRRVKRKLPTVRPNRKRSRTSASSSQNIPDVLNPRRCLDLSQQQTMVGQHPNVTEVQPEGRKVDSNGYLASMASDNHGLDTAEGAIVKSNSCNPVEKSAADIESPVQTDELTIRPHHYKIEVVENPDWLPKGWITELKTRSTGGSAGCKDKYYYDPVSKRRCRSQKEVFCFLETGKLGRYKRKQQPGKVLCLDLEQQVNNGSELQITETEELPCMRSLSQPYSQEGAPGPPGILPGGAQRGWGGGMFLPYRPGHTADILYDSLTNLSRPGLDQYRYIDPIKSSGDKSLNPSRPWFMANSEVSSGALVDRIEMNNITEVGQGYGRSRQSSAAAAKRARKSTKQAVN